ncbi:MAG: hypothetical protein AAFX52_15940 [Pseudomonadota bacterium]
MKKLLGIVPVLLLATGTSFAQTDDVIFNGTVSDSCTVVADTNGTLGLNGTGTVLASTETGGAAGQATITATGTSFNVTIDAITNFTTGPADADTNTTFSTTYDASGATTAAGVDGATPTSLGSGITTLGVNANATKTTGIFSAGTYSLTATVRCAP